MDNMEKSNVAEEQILETTKKYYKEEIYERKYKKSKVLNIISISLVFGMILGSIFTFGFLRETSPDSPKIAEATGITNAKDWYTDPVVNVAEEVLPSIVMIKSKANVSNGFMTQNLDKGTGSGIIYKEDGYIITNQHVIDGASQLEVILNDGRTFEGRVIGQDVKTDLAVIKINGSKLPVGKLGDSSKLKVGELAVAIGNPVGEQFSGSVTAGIISALNRSITIGGEKKLELIQTDAAVNPGNSGGALANKDGEIIGINSAKLESLSIEGMSFAIPINDAIPIIDQLVDHGYVKRPWIGVGIANVTDDIAKEYNIPKGIYIAKVYYNSPAEKFGLKVEDVITEINGEKINNVEKLSQVIEKYNPGDRIKLKVYRNKNYMDIDIELGTMSPQE